MILGQIEGEDIFLHEDGCITFRAKAAIDTDGSGPLHGDPYAQRDTTLHHNGKPLNADEDCYIVVPPLIISRVQPIVMGCQARVRNLHNDRESDAVVGDIGPHKKLGEISVALAKALGINPSPTSGGLEEHVVEYTIFPGTAAVVGKKTYSLQHA